MISAMNAMATTVPIPKVSSPGDQTADLINDGGYNVSVSTHVADCESSPLAVVHLTLDGAHCREARCAQQVERHEGIRADLREVSSQLAPDFGAVLCNLADEVIQLTEGSNNVLLCDQTGDGGNGGFQLPKPGSVKIGAITEPMRAMMELSISVTAQNAPPSQP